MTGEVHDPRSRALEGVAGHAGLFATADDMALYAQMLLDGGISQGQRNSFSSNGAPHDAAHPVPRGLRSYGWDVQTGYSGNRGELFTPGQGFGHTGFTGTSLWIDPGSRTAVIVLTSSVHPEGKGDVRQLRSQVATLAAAALSRSGTEVSPHPEVLTGLRRPGGREVRPAQGTPYWPGDQPHRP